MNVNEPLFRIFEYAQKESRPYQKYDGFCFVYTKVSLLNTSSILSKKSRPLSHSTSCNRLSQKYAGTVYHLEIERFLGILDKRFCAFEIGKNRMRIALLGAWQHWESNHTSAGK